MRLIPKKTKVNPTVWLNFTLFDMVLAILLFVGAFLIAMSNFEVKWGILLAYVSFSVMLFFPDDGERAYNELIYILRYFASRKKYEKGAKHVFREYGDKKTGHVFHLDVRAPLARQVREDELAFLRARFADNETE